MRAAAFSTLSGAVIATSFVKSASAAQLNSTIEWSSCADLNPAYGNFNDSLRCGYYDVPLDWADESVGTARLAVVRYPAADKEKKGTIFFNPGGPGQSGLDFVIGGAESILLPLVGTGYDLVAWDPRGTGFTTPSDVRCFDSAEEQAAYGNGSLLQNFPVDPTNALLDAADVAEFYSRMNETDALYKGFGKQCVERRGDVLKYLGTAAAVRDMVALADYLEPERKEINYYGISYGTVIGATFVNMFPDRVGRVVIDGVVDAQLYSASPGYETISASVESRDAALLGFAKECAKAGTRCSFRLNATDTGDDILDRIYGMMKTINDLTKAGSLPDEVPNYTDIIKFIFNSLYTPNTWSTLADQLTAIYELLNGGDTTSVSRRFIKRQDTQDLPTSDSTLVISCGDSVDAGNTTIENTWDEILFVTRNISPLFGPLFNAQGTSCYAWPVRAVERYSGPWNNKLSNKILVIGNQADPVTPFRNAKQVADQLGESAVLIEQSGYGHGSIAEYSNCTMSILQSYFESGKTPENDRMYCFVNEDNLILFPDQSNNTANATASTTPDDDSSAPSFANAVDLSVSDTTSAYSDNLNDAIDEVHEDVEVADLRQAKNTLMITTIVFGALSVILGAALAFVVIRSLRERAKYSRVRAAEILEPAWAANTPAVVDPYADRPGEKL
ncbi:alpha/beta-hydrolase [Schizophyllum commune H4-8]|uniref:Peptidase S33 tripeptidyl aminopeptidase-like C-terminal domain-containing protein n=1 Tax=Schizophyllum commune (strain H4-8 / FGSC 9210) TaxID=578458 RepID=D8Q512_SCHCM|nr:alpha/beta-hydrolase [Schizophyllum commune H4-8]KAI5892383.1 alpha/beta-hydrolase [Schizophyllum commune H4-8]